MITHPDELIGRKLTATVDEHGHLEDAAHEPLPAPKFSRENIETILSVIPHEAKCCYTGQSILAYCPDPTFSWEEINAWPDETDVDIFVYNKVGLAALVQAYISAGWAPVSSTDEFKADRIRFWESPRKFNLQTVALGMDGLPNVNLTWHIESDNVVSTVQRFDMDYLMVGMDVRTREFIDLRGRDHRVANVNRLNNKFDIDDVDVMFWMRQFDRIPKGWARGIDTRPVAKTYMGWLEESIKRGDRTLDSKTRAYADRRMNEIVEVMVDAGFTRREAEAMYHLVRGEDRTWEAMRLGLEKQHQIISDWLTSVFDD